MEGKTGEKEPEKWGEKLGETTEDGSAILTVASIRKAMAQLCNQEIVGSKITTPQTEVCLTIGGVVSMGNGCYMHPDSFRDEFGQDAYRELLTRPRVICPYDLDEYGQITKTNDKAIFP